MLPSADEIVANFEFLDDWEERYRYLIELGRMMPALPDESRTDANKVMGCASQVWLETGIEPARSPNTRLIASVSERSLSGVEVPWALT